MTDAELITRLRGGRIAMLGHEAMLAADRLAQLSEDNERLRVELAGARVAAMKEAVSICKRVRHEIDTDEGAAGALEAALAILDAMKEPCCAALAQGQKEGD
ncbi:hypothetical protein [Paracoccus yeei]|uniref:hypothetical protein n=1 Tax=Paracoccus yeei TaxID=147645 RepID=UPI00174C2991|nr:hypothetical protein [Paracoccus yeei]